MLRQFGLKQLVLRTREQVSLGAGDGGNNVVDGDGLRVQGTLFVNVGGQDDR